MGVVFVLTVLTGAAGGAVVGWFWVALDLSSTVESADELAVKRELNVTAGFVSG